LPDDDEGRKCKENEGMKDVWMKCDQDDDNSRWPNDRWECDTAAKMGVRECWMRKMCQCGG